ncbi:hypothetical protein XENOCAPTIV_011029 [Xenoophorus captivus]|uniref:Uncharacterized protein n=1 Tax=Xenoophorus captivus TaxID=1517983 RepID=A0ABV0QSB6_9TELE
MLISAPMITLHTHLCSTPKTRIHLQKRKTTGNEASDGNMEGIPAVLFTAAEAPILGCCQEAVHGLSVRMLPSGSGAGLWVVLVILVKVAVLHHAEAGGGAQIVAAPLVLLDGLVE